MHPALINARQTVVEEINTKRAVGGAGPWNTYYNIIVHIESGATR